MKLIFHSHHLKLSPQLVGYSFKKFSKIAQQHPQLQTLHLKLASSRFRHQAEVHYADGGLRHAFKVENWSLLGSIDRLRNKVMHQISKAKYKRCLALNRHARLEQRAWRQGQSFANKNTS